MLGKLVVVARLANEIKLQRIAGWLSASTKSKKCLSEHIGVGSAGGGGGGRLPPPPTLPTVYIMNSIAVL